MSKREKIGGICSVIVLILLFLMSSTDLLIKERVPEILPISVIIRDDSDSFYQNFKKGMDQAAKEYSADVNFITLYEDNDSLQQQMMIKREIEDGAKAIVLAPVNEQDIRKMVEGKQLSRPVVMIDSQPAGDLAVSDISMDYYEAGELAAEGLVCRLGKDTPVYLLTSGLDYGPNRQVYEGASAVLEREGYDYSLVSGQSENRCRELIESFVYPEIRPSAIIALDGDSLSKASEILAGSSAYQRSVSGLYGIGATTAVLNRMDEEIVDGIVVCNQYDAGYMSIQKAVEMINNPGSKSTVTLKANYIEKKDLRAKRFEKMLYPIE